MKNLILLSILLIITSCKKKLTQFNVDYNSEVVVSSTVGQAIPFSVATPEITTNSEQEFDANDTRSDRIKTIFLKDLVMTIVSPQGQTFSFLNSVEIFISSPNVAEKKVAFRENIPSNAGTTLACDLVDVDLQEYIKQDSYKIRVKTVTDETIAQDVHIDLYTNFLVEAKLKK